jgi:hypothetical protein
VVFNFLKDFFMLEPRRQELKDKWITALRSGEYKQGTGSLYDKVNDAYCCMGVLGCVSNDIKGETRTPGLLTGRNNGYHVLITEFANRDGISVRILIDMNDGDNPSNPKKYTFAEIADYLEENIK